MDEFRLEDSVSDRFLPISRSVRIVSSRAQGSVPEQRDCRGEDSVTRSRKPSVFQVGKVRDDGRTVVISGWGLGLCAQGCACHRHPSAGHLAIEEDQAGGRLGPRHLPRRWLRLLRAVDRRGARRDPARPRRRHEPAGPGAPRRLIRTRRSACATQAADVRPGCISAAECALGAHCFSAPGPLCREWRMGRRALAVTDGAVHRS